MDTEVIEAPAGTSPATATETDPISQPGTPEATGASKSGDHAEHTPPAEDEFAEFKATVAKATGTEPADTDSADQPEAGTAKTDEPAAPTGEPKEPDALSQENGKVPDKIDDRPEWKKLSAIANRVSKADGKEVRAIMREFYKREYDLTQQVEKARPYIEVVEEMKRSVGGSEQGFTNMRSLINNFEADPAASVPQLKMLLEDAMKRAGMVLQSPELVTEAETLKQQLDGGLIDQADYERRHKETLELEQLRTGQKRTQEQTQAERQRQQRAQSEAATQQTAQAINQAEETWADGKLKSDPDFTAVQELHGAFAQQNSLDFWKTNQRLPTPTEAVAILEKSLKQAKELAAKFRPKPRARQAITGGSNGSSGNNRQQPSSELDEFRAEVEAAQERHRR